MADKKYELEFGLSDGTSKKVQFTAPQGPEGKAGKTAYEYAKDGGYTGTEAEFAAKLAEESTNSGGNFVVNISEKTFGTGITGLGADKPVTDICAAYKAGKNVVGKVIDEESITYICPLVQYVEDDDQKVVAFSMHTTDNTFMRIIGLTDGVEEAWYGAT